MSYRLRKGMVRQLCRLILLLTVVFAAPSGARVSASHIAQAAGWNWAILPAARFDLASASRRGDGRSDVLIVYLEGDGLAYAAQGRRALDPTPTDPLALRLAVHHPGAGAVAWLARPCQYAKQTRACDSDDWTIARYGHDVIASVGSALDRLKAQAGRDRLILVGYSGGGAVAALLAERRRDVAGLVTIAANLDLAAWVRARHLTPLSRSLDPATDAARLSALPQVHFVGGEDRVVDPPITRAFRARMAETAPVTIVVVPGQDHGAGWASRWQDLALSAELAAIDGWR
jgi:pimeloyl-ACP methyl ester carboxylesterase